MDFSPFRRGSELPLPGERDCEGTLMLHQETSAKSLTSKPLHPKPGPPRCLLPAGDALVAQSCQEAIMKESGKRGTSPGRQKSQQQPGHQQQPDEGQGGRQQQQEQSQGQQKQPGQRSPQRQNQNIGPSEDEEGSPRRGSRGAQEE